MNLSYPGLHHFTDDSLLRPKIPSHLRLPSSLISAFNLSASSVSSASSVFKACQDFDFAHVPHTPLSVSSPPLFPGLLRYRPNGSCLCCLPSLFPTQQPDCSFCNTGRGHVVPLPKPRRLPRFTQDTSHHLHKGPPLTSFLPCSSRLPGSSPRHPCSFPNPRAYSCLGASVLAVPPAWSVRPPDICRASTLATHTSSSRGAPHHRT